MHPHSKLFFFFFQFFTADNNHFVGTTALIDVGLSERGLPRQSASVCFEKALGGVWGGSVCGMTVSPVPSDSQPAVRGCVGETRCPPVTVASDRLTTPITTCSISSTTRLLWQKVTSGMRRAAMFCPHLSPVCSYSGQTHSFFFFFFFIYKLKPSSPGNPPLHSACHIEILVLSRLLHELLSHQPVVRVTQQTALIAV